MVRRYRFAPLDRSGWLLGLGGPQCVALGAGLVVSGLALRAGVSIVVAAIPMALAGGFAFARLGGRALHEWVPVLTGWIGLRWRHEDRWFVPLGVLGGPSDEA